jgi:hypothetical protein
LEVSAGNTFVLDLFVFSSDLTFLLEQRVFRNFLRGIMKDFLGFLLGKKRSLRISLRGIMKDFLVFLLEKKRSFKICLRGIMKDFLVFLLERRNFKD